MSDRWVIDASIGLAWVHPAQATGETDLLLRELKQGAVLVVPALWFQEMANALLVLERRRKLKTNERRDALAMLRALNTEPDLHGATLAFGKLSELAETHALTVYDATYLELALRERLPLGTKDQALRAVARSCGASLLLQ